MTLIRVRELIDGDPVAPGDKGLLLKALRGAPFSNEEREVRKWIFDRRDRRVLGTFLPEPHGQPSMITEDMVLNSLHWHTAKHRVLGDFEPNTNIHQYLEDLRAVLMYYQADVSVFVGIDPKADQERVGLLLKLRNGGAPCCHVRHFAGAHIFLAYSPRTHQILTGFLVDDRTVRGGYPSWKNQVEVDR